MRKKFTINIEDLHSLSNEEVQQKMQDIISDYKDCHDKQKNGYVVRLRIKQDGVEKIVDIALGIKHIDVKDDFFFILEEEDMLLDFLRQPCDDFEIISIEAYDEYKNIIPLPFDSEKIQQHTMDDIFYVDTDNDGLYVTECYFVIDDSDTEHKRDMYIIRKDNNEKIPFDITRLYYINGDEK